MLFVKDKTKRLTLEKVSHVRRQLECIHVSNFACFRISINKFVLQHSPRQTEMSSLFHGLTPFTDSNVTWIENFMFIIITIKYFNI